MESIFNPTGPSALCSKMVKKNSNPKKIQIPRMNPFTASILVSMKLTLAVLFTAATILMAGDPPAEGTKAPTFTLKSQEGTPVSLSDYKGKWVVLYFYPKDMT